MYTDRPWLLSIVRALINHTERQEPEGNQSFQSSAMSGRQLRIEPPDVIVAVGKGEAMQEIGCHRTTLRYASEYFNTMLSSSMQKRKNFRIEFPDKDPNEKEPFHSLVENVMTLLPWTFTIVITWTVSFANATLSLLPSCREARDVPPTTCSIMSHLRHVWAQECQRQIFY